MSMGIWIKEFRLSFIWFERLSTLLDGSVLTAPMAFLGAPDTFVKAFNDAREETIGVVEKYRAQNPTPSPADPDYPRLMKAWRKAFYQHVNPLLAASTALMPPWPYLEANYTHYFWLYYLRRNPNKIDGEIAWQYFVPLRTGFSAKIKASRPRDRVLVDGLLYPHGIAVIIMLGLQPEHGTGDDPESGMTLHRAVQRAVDARSKDSYDVRWDNGTPERLKLDGLAFRLLDHLRERTLGAGAPDGVRSINPFSIATIIRGSGVQSALPVPPNGDIHRALEALSTWHASWQTNQLHDLDKARLRLRFGHPKGHVLYHLERSRAVWFPDAFQSRHSFKRTLGCYHRNLTLLSLQTEAMIQMLRLRAGFKEAGAAVPDVLDVLAHSAADRLGILYGSNEDSYQSSSPRAYIDETKGLKQLINEARHDYVMQELHWEEWE